MFQNGNQVNGLNMKQQNLFLKNEEPKKAEIEIKPLSPNPNPFLGPKTPATSYAKYINSKDWRNKSKYALHKRGNRCERCYSKKQLEVHHKHYDTLYLERLEDVEVLCKKCHPHADAVREHKAAYATWAYKKYGENWWRYDDESLYDEFEDWLKWKERENDY